MNNGTLVIPNGTALRLYQQSTVENANQMTLGDGSSVSSPDGSAVSLSNDVGATISYTGSTTSQTAYIQVPFTNAGTVAVMQGTLNITAIARLGSVTVQVSSDSNFGHVQVVGSTVMGGKLTVLTAGGYSPAEGNTFQIITTGGLTGTFSAVNAVVPDGDSYKPSYSSTGVTVEVVRAPSITSNNSAVFAVGTAQTFNITTSGFPAVDAITEAGALPNGVQFTDGGSGTASFSGMPAVGSEGSYPINLTASNSVNPDAHQSFTLIVQKAPTITSASSTIFTVGQSNTFTVTSTGFPASTLTKTGILPAGVTFTDHGDGTATIAGNPAVGSGAVYPTTITADNGVSPSDSQSFTLTVNEAPRITSAAAITFTVGVNNSFAVHTSGYPAPTLSETGAFPSGVQWTDNADGTGALSGMPVSGTGGTYTLSIAAGNGTTPNAHQTFLLHIVQKPTFTSASTATFTIGKKSSFAIRSIGFPSTNLRASGKLPKGVKLTIKPGGTATLAGKPVLKTGKNFVIVLVAANSIGTTTQRLTLTVQQKPAFKSKLAATFTVGKSSTFLIKTKGFPAPTLTEVGELPTGLTFAAAPRGTARITGKPGRGTAMSYTLKITARNGAGSVTKSFKLTVRT